MEMPVPNGWEVRTRLEILAPRQEVAVPLMRSIALPRANVVALRYQPGHNTEDLLKTLRESGAHILRESAFVFTDQVSAVTIHTRLDLPNGMQLAQDHIVRRDGDELTHLTLTYGPGDADGQRSLEDIVRNFVP